MNTTVSRFISWSVLGIGAALSVFFLYDAIQYENAEVFPQTLSGEAVSLKYMGLAQKHVLTDYNLAKAADFYVKALAYDSTNSAAMYELARVQSVRGKLDSTLALAERYIQKFPNDPKILYTAGLAAGFAGDFVKAESYFDAYLEKNPNSKWQSRLDLAWALYQQGKYAEAREVLAAAIERFGGNAWLHTSIAAVEYALGDKDAAKEAIVRAEQEIDAVDINTWNTNYSFNGPGHYEKGIAQMKQVIAINKALITGSRVPEYTRDSFTRMVGFAPDIKLGLVVSACGESCGPQTCYSAPNSCGAVSSWTINSCVDSHGSPTINNQTCSDNPLPTPPVPDRYGQSCTSINLCGIQATGTVQCDGRCSALAPLPNAFGQGCTIRNRCGSANGVVGCNGQCNVSRYPTCLNPDDSVTGGDDGWTEVTINDDGRFPGQNYGNIGVQISVSPNLVRSGQRTVVRWNSAEMSSCTVTGTNGDSWTGLAGEEITRPITLRVTYTLSCTAFDGRTMTDTAVVGLAPVMCEIGQQGCEQQQ